MVLDDVPVAVAGGVESISLVQNNLNQAHASEPWLTEHKPELFMTMLDTRITSYNVCYTKLLR